MPAKLAPSLAKGATVTIDARLAGGGPNARGQTAISDDTGPIVAIDLMPIPWTAEQGARVSIDHGNTYDSTTFAVLVRAPKSDPAELVEGWRAFAVAGHHYAGTGNAATRDLHGKSPAPDYVGSWIDFAIVRTDP